MSIEMTNEQIVYNLHDLGQRQRRAQRIVQSDLGRCPPPVVQRSSEVTHHGFVVQQTVTVQNSCLQWKVQQKASLPK
jgi:hypothetical protein